MKKIYVCLFTIIFILSGCSYNSNANVEINGDLNSESFSYREVVSTSEYNKTISIMYDHEKDEYYGSVLFDSEDAYNGYYTFNAITNELDYKANIYSGEDLTEQQMLDNNLIFDYQSAHDYVNKSFNETLSFINSETEIDDINGKNNPVYELEDGTQVDINPSRNEIVTKYKDENESKIVKFVLNVEKEETEK